MRCITLPHALSLLLLLVPVLAGKNSAPSKPNKSGQICPSSEPASCYPRLFVPTLDFQPVREGQQLPPGLHIRLNVQTMEKEARLNVPIEDMVEREAKVEKIYAGEGLAALMEVPQPEEREELR
jgi:nucleotide exchange factor SIL1